MRLLRRHLRAQEGITLIMAIGILGVLSLTGATLIYYSTSNARGASASKGRETAYTLAEAGVAQALSVLNSSLNPLTGSLLSSTTLQLEGGSVTYSGSLSGETWTITATGTVKNPAGASDITRTLTRQAQVYGLNSGASVAAWSRWYADSTTSCLTIEDVEITMPIATRGDLCMKGSASITGSSNTLEVGDDVTMTASTTSSLRDPSAATGWTSSSSVYTSNNVRATTTLAASAQSANLDVTGFSFNLPSGSTVVGIEATVERMASSFELDRGLRRLPPQGRRGLGERQGEHDGLGDLGLRSHVRRVGRPVGDDVDGGAGRGLELRHPPEGAQPDDLVAHGVRGPRRDPRLLPAAADDSDRQRRARRSPRRRSPAPASTSPRPRTRRARRRTRSGRTRSGTRRRTSRSRPSTSTTGTRTPGRARTTTAPRAASPAASTRTPCATTACPAPPR